MLRPQSVWGPVVQDSQRYIHSGDPGAHVEKPTARISLLDFRGATTLRSNLELQIRRPCFNRLSRRLRALAASKQ